MPPLWSPDEEGTRPRKGAVVVRLAATQLEAGPAVAGCRILQNEEQYVLVINGRIAPLTPTEYLLVMALLRQRAQWEAAVGRAPFAASHALLRQVTGIEQQKLLARHMSNASLKLFPLGIRLICVREGYAAFFAHDLAERESHS
jgi:hypothetical protein